MLQNTLMFISSAVDVLEDGHFCNTYQDARTNLFHRGFHDVNTVCVIRKTPLTAFQNDITNYGLTKPDSPETVSWHSSVFLAQKSTQIQHDLQETTRPETFYFSVVWKVGVCLCHRSDKLLVSKALVIPTFQRCKVDIVKF